MHKLTIKAPIGIVISNPRIVAEKYKNICIHATTLAFGKQPTAAILAKVLQVNEHRAQHRCVYSHVTDMIHSVIAGLRPVDYTESDGIKEGHKQ